MGFESSRGFGRARRRSPKAKPEGEARRRSPKAKPEGEAPKRSPTKKPTNFIIATKTPHTHKHRKQRTAHREPRRHARDHSEQPRRATGDSTPRASQDETDEETGTREARRNSTKESCQQAHTYSVHDRRRDANKGGTPIKSNIRGQGNPEPQPPQTTPDRAHHHKKSKARPEPTERPTKRPSDRPGGDIPCR